MVLAEDFEITFQFLLVKAKDLGIAVRNSEPSSHLSSTALKSRKLMQKGNPRQQHNVVVHNSNNGISFVPNSVPNRRKFPVSLLFFLQLLYVSCGNVHCHSPQNVAENIGERVYISCAFNNSVHPCQNMVWTHYAAHTLAPTDIFMQGNLSFLVSDYISMPDSNDGYCNLEIKTRTSAEGKYECSMPSTGKKESASLIILAGYPECTVKTVGEYYNITCWVEYFGDWAPTMEWIKMTRQDITSISPYESFTSDQIVSPNLVVPRNISAGYMCIMKFTEQGRKTKTTANNVPEYEWTSLIFGENGVEGGNETACPVQKCSANSFGFNGRVAILSLLIWILNSLLACEFGFLCL